MLLIKQVYFHLKTINKKIWVLPLEIIFSLLDLNYWYFLWILILIVLDFYFKKDIVNKKQYFSSKQKKNINKNGNFNLRNKFSSLEFESFNLFKY